MKLSHSVALGVISALSANALVIPSIAELPSIFALNPEEQVLKVVPDKAAELVTKKPSPAAVAAPSAQIASIFKPSSGNEIPHSYIIVFKDHVTPDAVDFHLEWVKEAHSNSAAKSKGSKEFDSFSNSVKAAGIDNVLGGFTGKFNIGNFKGYTGYFLPEVLELLKLNPDVAFIEQDQRVFASDFAVQNGAPWGLSRISHRQSLNLGSFNKYLYDDDAGKGVTAYVIDTGVSVTHEEFGGRAKWGKTIPDNDEDLDGNGHGTHCAGTIGSEHYGVAKGADIVAVKVLKSNGSGTMSDVVKGVEFAAQAHVAAAKKGKKGFKGSTANMSLGGGKSPALDMAVNAAVRTGLHFAVAAGNDNADACKYSPAAAENAVTVGASTLSDFRAYFSNYGKCVDIFGPGLNILSTYIGSDTATATLSGTSMASPHVCGLLTYFLSLQPDSESLYASGGSSAVTPAQLKKNIIAYSTPDVLSDIPDDGTPNLLIYNGAGQNLTAFWEGSIDEASRAKDVEFTESVLREIKEELLDIEESFSEVMSSFIGELKEEVFDAPASQ
ncbi:unnamed protein product [Kuraishia capsulata CBS 1993]|uniref:Peptidase S8/S53 domain-containing protein n=1 Tax=Kuraishia capsulata CBS 1993 TaxID=1382522 RepID=W6MRF3_9ASCO|nr:uncharacterized protein KUCA_T00000382001 [Kuraishia capsulata CBS 1993]CDK24420.1 unnamed protein product [Kuraishia capsulata CBS 1993]